MSALRSCCMGLIFGSAISLLFVFFLDPMSPPSNIKVPRRLPSSGFESDQEQLGRTFYNWSERPNATTPITLTTLIRNSYKPLGILPTRKPVSKVNCNALVKGDAAEQTKTLNLLENETTSSYSGADYLKLTRNCTKFKTSRGYIISSLTHVEENFPIAFSLLMFKDIAQTERLLRAIYRPQNVYCVHVDVKASDIIKQGMSAISLCFDNVFLVSNPVDVRWGTFTVLEPELKCMEELWAFKRWKYFINLTGQEFPLKTNLELVKILSVYNGANNMEGTRRYANKDRWAGAGTPPHGIIPTKGSVHIVVCRGFVDYVLHNKTARDFLAWIKQTSVPDETFFSSLNHNPHLGVPGSYMGEPETDLLEYPFLTRYKGWSSGIFQYPCYGKYVRGICVLGIKDLPRVTGVPHLFVNKLHWDYQHYAWDCLEEWHYNKTGREFVDEQFYGNLTFVRNAVRQN